MAFFVGVSDFVDFEFFSLVLLFEFSFLSSAESEEAFLVESVVESESLLFSSLGEAVVAFSFSAKADHFFLFDSMFPIHFLPLSSSRATTFA